MRLSKSWFTAAATLLAAAAVLALPAGAAPPPTQLPRTVRPLHYDVALVPDAASLTFTGQVAIAIEVLKPVRSITLNANGLAFTRVGLSGTVEDEAGFGEPATELDPAAQTATFRFAKTVPPGRYQLVLEYRGTINTRAFGLFAIDYDAATGPGRALYTQFESSDARRVIPCWDEPAYKATFALEATVANGEVAVSNMPVAGTEDLHGGRTRVRFAQTPPMSTYLLFLSVGDFERAAAGAGGAEVGVVTRRGMLPQAAFALEASQAIMREYDGYFGIPYALPKLDNVAAPGSSQMFGAMENWGAILTWEYGLLVDPTISTEADRQFIFSQAAHEISHQWFGNLVTMQWWDDLWLNEGFASWMESRTTTRLHPEWRTALQNVGVRDRAMERDALATTHPVVQHVETVEQMDQAFDDITYEKGEAVIRMLEAYVGDAAWRDGVRAYLKAHAYGNTVSDDLWRAIGAAAQLPVADVARDFTNQPGVPLIRVDGAACTDGATTLRLVQDEYTRDRPGKRPLAWRVPVMAATLGAEGAPARTLVRGGKATLAVPGCGPVVVNAGQSGYYRTLYGRPQFAELAARFADVAPIDQLGILADSWALGLVGRQPVTDFLDLARATPVAADPQVWRRIAGVMRSLDTYYAGEPARRAEFRRFANGLLSPVFATVGWTARPGEPSTVTVLRTDLVEILGGLGEPGAVAEARRRYAAQAGDPGAVPAELRKAILGVVARHADAATWGALRAAAAAEKTPLVRDQLWILLADAEDPALARQTLELALTPEPGATTSADMIAEVSLLHPDLAFDFAIANLDAVMGKVDAPSYSRYVPVLATRSADPAMIGKLRAYAAAHLPPGARRDAETAAARVADRIRVRNERLPALDAWLQAAAAGRGP